MQTVWWPNVQILAWSSERDQAKSAICATQESIQKIRPSSAQIAHKFPNTVQDRCQEESYCARTRTILQNKESNQKSSLCPHHSIVSPLPSICSFHLIFLFLCQCPLFIPSTFSHFDSPLQNVWTKVPSAMVGAWIAGWKAPSLVSISSRGHGYDCPHHIGRCYHS